MKALDFLATPWRDFASGFARCLDSGVRGLLMVFAGWLLGWWLYVPLHELLHAFGCQLSGGEVSRLEIDAVYGGALLAHVFPFVYVGSDYAGQLTGFDTLGSDLVYLATDLFPFLLTLFPGVWAFRRFGRLGRSFRFGFSLPFALAPFLSLSGDAYEIGSIIVTQVPPWSRAECATSLRGDDVFVVARELANHSGAPWVGGALSFLVGVVWAFATYRLGVVFARDRRSS